MEIIKKKEKKKENSPEYECYVMDIRYSSAYNPERITRENDEEYSFIVDGDGKEKLLVKKIHRRNV